MGGFGFSAILSSPLVRARQTAAIIAGLPEDSDEIVVVPELFDAATPEEQTILDGMFQELGHAPLDVYYEHSKADTLRKFAARARQAVITASFHLGYPTARVRSEVLFIGHGVLLPAMIYDWSGNKVCDSLRAHCATSVLEEGNGYCLHLAYNTEIVGWNSVEFD